MCLQSTGLTPARRGSHPRVGVDAPPEVFRASLFKGADSKINARVNPLNVTDELFRRKDITGASDAAVFAELAGNVADGI